MIVGLALEALVVSPDLEKHLSDVMDQLCDLDEAIDPDIDANLSTGEVRLAVAVEAANELEAIEKAVSLIRSAIHAAGGTTHEDDGWSLRDLRPTDRDALVA